MAYELDRNASPAAAVQFKLGTQAAMDQLLSRNATNPGGVHGTFYLTQDTHRLYVGNSDNTISPVNEGIITVANMGNLPNATSTPPARPGQFYYLTEDNILAIYNGQNWVQINSTSAVSQVTVTGTNQSGTIKVETGVRDTGGTYKDHFTLSGADGITLANAGDDGENITITGNIVSASGEDYTDGVTVTLNNSNGTDDTINLKEGTNATIEMNNDGDIVFSAVDSTISEVTTSTRAEAAGGGFGIKVKDTSGANQTGYITPQIKYGSSGGSTVGFYNGVATLSIYTKAETDTAISTAVRTVNAMTYKGLATSSTLPGVADNVEIGDTYVLTDAATYQGTTYPAGSMVIASAENTEGADGYITGASIKWDYVNSTGSDTTYSASNASNGFTISPSTGGTTAKFMLAAGTAITMSAAGDVNTTDGRTVTITHANVASTKTHVAANDIEELYNNDTIIPEIVTGITVNDQGHVTGYTVQKLTLHSQIGTFEAIDYANTANNENTTSRTYTNIVGTAAANGYTATSSANVKLGYSLKKLDGSNSRASNGFNIATRSLEITTSGMNAYVDLVWGSFS